MRLTNVHKIYKISWGILVLLSSWRIAETFAYVVKKGDSLSQIADSKVPGPVWGKSGSLRKILALNPSVRNPDFILPGDQLILNSDLASGKTGASSQFNRAPADNQIFISPNSPPHHADLVFSPIYTFSGISSVDRTTGYASNIVTSLNAGADIAYFQNWNNETRTFLHLKLNVVTFQPPADTNKSVSGSGKVLPDFGFGGTFDLSTNTHLSLLGDYQEFLFAHSNSTVNVFVDGVVVPSLGLKMAWDLTARGSYTLGLSANASADFPTSTDLYSINFGGQFGGSLYLIHSNQKSEEFFRAEVEFLRRNQNTSLTNMSENDLTPALRFPFSFSNNKEDENVQK